MQLIERPLTLASLSWRHSGLVRANDICCSHVLPTNRGECVIDNHRVDILTVDTDDGDDASRMAAHLTIGKRETCAPEEQQKR